MTMTFHPPPKFLKQPQPRTRPSSDLATHTHTHQRPPAGRATRPLAHPTPASYPHSLQVWRDRGRTHAHKHPLRIPAIPTRVECIALSEHIYILQYMCVARVFSSYISSGVCFPKAPRAFDGFRLGVCFLSFGFSTVIIVVLKFFEKFCLFSVYSVNVYCL